MRMARWACGGCSGRGPNPSANSWESHHWQNEPSNPFARFRLMAVQSSILYCTAAWCMLPAQAAWRKDWSLRNCLNHRLTAWPTKSSTNKASPGLLALQVLDDVFRFVGWSRCARPQCAGERILAGKSSTYPAMELSKELVSSFMACVGSAWSWRSRPSQCWCHSSMPPCDHGISRGRGQLFSVGDMASMDIDRGMVLEDIVDPNFLT